MKRRQELKSEKLRRQWAKMLKDKRAEKGMSQEDLAAVSRYTLSYIQKIEVAAKGSSKAIDELMGKIEAWSA